MKKILLTSFAFLVSSIALLSQSSLQVTDLNNGSAIMTSGAVFFETVGANGMNQLDYNFKNTSATTKTYGMRMYKDLRHVVGPADSANPYFCFGGFCYDENTLVSPNNQTLLANQDANALNKLINIHYDEASIAGLSVIRYRIFNIAAPTTDYFEFTVRYNDPTASVKNIASTFGSVSEIYPNPSSVKALLTITATSETLTKVTISNTLGSIVSSKTIDLSIGKNTVPLDIENLNTGIYFVTITNGNSKIVKKFTVNK